VSHRIRRCFPFAILLALSTAVPAQTRPPAIELVEPAPGCPVKMPTLDGLLAYCGAFDRGGCGAEARCTWENADRIDGKDVPPHCGVKEGTYLSPRATPPTHDRFIPDLGEALEELNKLARRPSEDLVDKAHDAAAGKRYDLAISLYTRALKLDDFGTYHLLRGLAYETKGEPKKALGDYCEALVHGLIWSGQNVADTRIAQVTRPDAARAPLPVFVKTGVMRMRKGRPGVAPLRIEASSKGDYVIKLLNAQDQGEEMLIYVRAGASFETKVPLGTYIIRGASGAFWYGEPALFGDDTSYFQLANKDGADDAFKFVQQGRQLSGFRLRLVSRQNGNLASRPIGAKDF